MKMIDMMCFEANRESNHLQYSQAHYNARSLIKGLISLLLRISEGLLGKWIPHLVDKLLFLFSILFSCMLINQYICYLVSFSIINFSHDESL